MAKHVISEGRRISQKGSLLSFEIDLPRIEIEIPTPAQIARRCATIVAAALRKTLAAGQDSEGRSLGAASKATMERRARDKRPPVKPRTNRYRERYPSGGAGSGSLRGVDSGYLAARIRVAASGSGSAEVEAPPERPIRDIEQRLHAVVFSATPAHLEQAVEEVLDGAFASWGGTDAATAAVRRGLK